MNILFVEDRPDLKIATILYQLSHSTEPHTSNTVKSVASAYRYIIAQSGKIDLVVLDLGLPLYDNGDRYHSLNGLQVIEKMIRKNINIPIIINSCTEIPNELTFLKLCEDHNIKILHVEYLNLKILTDFMNSL